MTEKNPIRLEGAPNFRDLGGYKTSDGRVVKRNCLFRSSNLSALSHDDFDILRRIPLRTVVDLRSAGEAQMFPSRWHEELDSKLVNAGINPYSRAEGHKYKQILLDDPTTRGALETMDATYRLLPDACGPALKVMVDCVLGEATPLVFHCSNGRDRTGIISMVLLQMLGVSRADILANYLESNSRIDLEAAIALSRTVFAKEYGVDFDYETLRTLNQALEQNVDIAFDTIVGTYGSLPAYLQAFDISIADQEALRNTLLETALAMTSSVDIRLEGASNFRDIGGWTTADGRRLKRERVFRSGELSQLTDADLDTLRGLGVAFVADLRSLKECELHRSRWPEGLQSELHQADITMDIRLDGQPIIDMIKEDRAPESVARTVGKSFPVIADLCGPALKRIVDQLASGVEPVVFHCTNGRDRTGVISAMLLYLLGAPREAIVADFMTTNERLDVERVIANTLDTFRKALGIDLTRESIEMVTLVRAEYIDAMFNGFESRYGSAEGYLAHFGIDEALRERLRERLLEAA